jgi:hypothetical protein
MGRTRTTRTRRWFATGPILAALAITACGGADSDDAAEATAESAATLAAGGEAPAADADLVATEEAARTGGDAGGAGTIDLGAVGKDVIVEMHVVMSSDDIARSVASITANASGLGGGIASSTVNYGERDGNSGTGHAVLVVKVPPASVTRLLDGLDTTGTVLSIDQSAQDVTEQLVDLDVRIANARQSVANVRGFMDRTTNLTELVALEGELTRRQTELEQLEAQQRNLSERVALATITVEILPTAAVPVTEPDDGIADAFGKGWDAFVSVAFGIVYVLAVLAPFLVIALAVAAIAWFVLGRRGPRPAPVTAGTAAETAPETGAKAEALSDDRENATPVA